MSVRVALRCCSSETDDKWQPATSKHGIHEAPCQSAVAVRKGMERKQHVTCKGRQGNCQHVARWQPALAAGSPAQPAFAMGVRSARDSKRPNAATSSSSELSSSSGGVTKRVLPMHTAPVRRAPPPETSVACAVRSPCAVMGCDAGHASMSCCISESRPQEGTTSPGRWALVSCSELREHSCCVACLDTASKYESLLRSAA